MRHPRLNRLRSVHQLCVEYPHLFTSGSLRWLIFNADINGFDASAGGSSSTSMRFRNGLQSIAAETWRAQPDSPATATTKRAAQRAALRCFGLPSRSQEALRHAGHDRGHVPLRHVGIALDHGK